MKVEAYLFLGCAGFFGAMDLVYWNLSHDPTGTTALALSVCLVFLIGFYVRFTGRRLPPRPEDDREGEIAEGTGELGFFSPHSWWPLFVGLAAALAAHRGGHRLVAVPARRVRGHPVDDRLRLRILRPRNTPKRSCV